MNQLEDVRELTAAQVDELLGRRHGWARRHIFALGGYPEGGQYRFPVHAVRAWQESQARAYAEDRGAA